MTNQQNPVVIKKYANRRLYNTGTSSYVTLDDLAVMVKLGEDFVVKDAKTGEDLTRNVLTQIIFDAESKGHSLLPTTFLRQLIRFYGDSMQTLVPPFLEHSLSNFAREQERLRAQMQGAFGTNAIQAMEDQARRNMEIFERSMRMFLPFPGDAADAKKPPEAGEEPAAPARRSGHSDLDDLKTQVAAMQMRIEQLVREREAAEAKALRAQAGEEPDTTAPEQTGSDTSEADQHS